jgi:hypothetical protein
MSFGEGTARVNTVRHGWRSKFVGILIAVSLSIAIPLAGLGVCFTKPQLNGIALVASSFLPLAALIPLWKFRGWQFAIGLSALSPVLLWAAYVGFCGMNLMDDLPDPVFARACLGDSEVVVGPDWDYDGLGEAVFHQRPLFFGLVMYRKLDTLPDGSRPRIAFSGPNHVTLSITAVEAPSTVRSYSLKPHILF